MIKIYELLLDALRCALHGEHVLWNSIEGEELSSLIELSREHHVLPMTAEALYLCPAVKAHAHLYKQLVDEARAMTVAQAQRTADFLLVYSALRERGLEPIVTKGIMCRMLYPHPDQRTSVDEDLLISPREGEAYCAAMTDLGLHIVEGDSLDSYETSYEDASKHLYIEVHKSFFDEGSEAYGDCNAPLSGAAERSVAEEYEKVLFRTLAPTDHLLYLIFHAYKHFLHGGFGIRQTADICVFACSHNEKIDFERIRTECEKLRIGRFAAALFAVGRDRLGVDPRAGFEDIEPDTEHLLYDMLSGGLYGVEDINRAHSGTMTLEAVAAQKNGRRRRGALASVFLPARSLSGRYPYLKKHPWLLPAAWVQRAWSYLTKREHGAVSPSETLKIGRERIELLREYGMID